LSSRNLTLVFVLKDSYGINEESISVKFNNVKMNYDYSFSNHTLSFGLNNLDPGEYFVEVECKNKNGNYSFPYKKTIVIK